MPAASTSWSPSSPTGPPTASPARQCPKIDAVLKRLAIHPDDREPVEAAFKAFCDLHDEGRDHIWGYYVRNLARPLWFTQPDNRVDVLVGNPPWLAYRFMSEAMQKHYRRSPSSADCGPAARSRPTRTSLTSSSCAAVEQYLRRGDASASSCRRPCCPGASTRASATATTRRVEATTVDPVRRALGPARRDRRTSSRCRRRWSLAAGRHAVPLPRRLLAFEGRIALRGTRWADAEGR